MSLNASFCTHLPVELYEEILTLAAWDASESDKPWLCALATTSRRVLALVRPILYDTVCMTTSAHVASILACAPHGHFALTRSLWADIAPDAWHARRLAAVFPNVRHFAASLLYLIGPDTTTDHRFRPTRLTLHTKLYLDDWRVLASESAPSSTPSPSPAVHDIPLLRTLTHLRLALNPYYDTDTDSLQISPSSSLQYIILESSTLGWNPTHLRDVLLPFFLSGAHIARVLICATPHAPYMADARALLAAFATARRERRLWWLDADGASASRFLAEYRPGATFGEDQWTAGRPLYQIDH